MAELIEKVARLAGWEYYEPTDDWFDGSTVCAAGGGGAYLTGDGLRILLDELLRAGFAIVGTYEVHQMVPFGGEVEAIETRGDTLEEAVMLAYVAMKGEG